MSADAGPKDNAGPAAVGRPPEGVVFQLYLRVAGYGFRRHATYRAAAVAGAFTNTVFGILRAYVLIALWEARPGLAGYDVADAITFCFLTQAFIGPAQIFGGGGLTLGERVRTGDVALDLVRPASLQLWCLAEDLGRAAYLFIVRSVPPTLVGAALFGLVVPDASGWAAFTVSLVLAVIVSFALRYLVALSACWILDERGVQSLSTVLCLFFSGMIVPLNLMPGTLGTVADALPWAAVLLGLGALVTRAARRKVVIQGG